MTDSSSPIKRIKPVEVLPVPASQPGLPPLLDGDPSDATRRRSEQFLGSVAGMFEAWVKRSKTKSKHTERSYRRDVMAFAEDFMQIRWPDEAWKLLQTSVHDVERWHEYMTREMDMAPKTINRRLSSLGRFFDYMQKAAANAKLPLNLQNPAGKDFVPRPKATPVLPTRALTKAEVRQLMEMPGTATLTALRDRAILKFYAYSAARIRTGCLIKVEHFRYDAHDPIILIQEKGKGKTLRELGINIEAAEAIRDYIKAAGITSGPLFRVKIPKKDELGTRALGLTAMYNLLQSYLEQLPDAFQAVEDTDGSEKTVCVYTPHSLRKTAATHAKNDAGCEITEVQDFLGHANVTTTQPYVDRIDETTDSPSHKLRF